MKKEERITIITIYILAFCAVVAVMGWVSSCQDTGVLKHEIKGLEEEIENRQVLKNINEQLIEEIKQLREEEIKPLQKENEELRMRIEEWLHDWEVMTKEITYYAPLDPNAVPGMCYSGNPYQTASGARTAIGTTVAAGPDIPFGTKVYIKGIGWRIVQDRGGAVGNNALDVAVMSREEALRRGREERVVIIEK